MISERDRGRGGKGIAGVMGDDRIRCIRLSCLIDIMSEARYW